MPKITVVPAPERPDISSKAITIFLAGATTPTGSVDWRDVLISKIEAFRFPEENYHHTNIVILNPLAKGWDSSWTDSMIQEQIKWELDMQEAAGLIVVFFQSVTVAPVSLLELGLAARTGKAVVFASPEYSKRLNVEAVCRRFVIPLSGELSELEQVLRDKIEEHMNIVGQEPKD